ncbi:MAG: cytochrome P450 [Alphaproteobacteria bacterium]
MPLDNIPVEAPFVPWSPEPPERPMPFLKGITTFLRNPLETIPALAYREPIVHARGVRDVFWVCDPSLVKDVLLDRRELFPKDLLGRRVLGPIVGDGILTAEGQSWRWQRQTVAPLFRHADLLGYVPAMVAGADVAVAAWRATPPGTRHQVDADMTRATYHVISNTVLAGGGDKVGEALGVKAERYGHGLQWSLAYAAVGVPEWAPRPLRRMMRRREALVRGAVLEIVRQRRQEAAGPDDLLARLMAATEPDTGRRMTDDELTDNLLTFLVAGHDTTAKALAWTLYLLARAPAWQQRVFAEVAAVVGDGPVAGDHIDRLAVTRQVLKESLRLFPSVPVMTRMAAEDVELGGRQVPKGTIVGIPIYAIHRHQALWDRPEAFDPARFAPEREKAHDRYQFMPFGGGPRVCVGGAFAMIEATAILASVVRAARFDWPRGPDPVPLSRIVLTPKHGIPLKVTLREA